MGSKYYVITEYSLRALNLSLPFFCRLVPVKIVRDWKMLFIAGRPLYEGEGDMNDAKSSSVSGSSTYDSTHKTHRDNQQLLDDTDFHEYKVDIKIINLHVKKINITNSNCELQYSLKIISIALSKFMLLHFPNLKLGLP